MLAAIGSKAFGVQIGVVVANQRDVTSFALIRSNFCSLRLKRPCSFNMRLLLPLGKCVTTCGTQKWVVVGGGLCGSERRLVCVIAVDRRTSRMR